MRRIRLLHLIVLSIGINLLDRYQKTFVRKHILLVLTLMILGSLIPATAAQAQPRTRCFKETGFCVSGAILDYWERSGGLAVFGYPVTEAKTETVEGTWSGPVQWFERDRLEDHSNEGQGVLAGRLGSLVLELQGRPWQSLFPAEHSEKPGCRYFVVTHFNLCEPFLSYWERNGGLARFGYPITPAFEETTTLDGGKTWRGTTQYFERRRMEYHPENKGTSHVILLGLLGREILSSPPCGMIRVPRLDRVISDQRSMLGCPTNVYKDLTLSVQPFERGWMVWAPAVHHGRSLIFVISRQPRGTLTWQGIVDTYREGEAVGGTDTPPPGRVAPIRGFGKVWWSNPDVREALGWALTPEAGETGTVTSYNHNGAWMIYRTSLDQVTVLYPNGSAIETR